MTLVRQVIVGEIYKLVDLIHQWEIHSIHLMNILLKKSLTLQEDIRKYLIYPTLDTWHGLKLIIQQSHAKNYVSFFPDALPLHPVDIIDSISKCDSNSVTPGLTPTRVVTVLLIMEFLMFH